MNRLSESGAIARRCGTADRAVCTARTGRGAIAAVLLLLAVPLALPTLAQAQTTLLSSTLTVRDSNGTLGCSNDVSGNHCSDHLTEDQYAISYTRISGHSVSRRTITKIGLQADGSLEVRITPKVTNDEWLATLAIGSENIDYSDHTSVEFTDDLLTSIITWENSGLSWSAGDTVTLSITIPNRPPISDLVYPQIFVAHNTDYQFETSDFAFTDPDPSDRFHSVRIVTLPTVGMLTFNGTPVTVNDVITRAYILVGRLVFSPATDAGGRRYAAFDFKVSDGTDDSTDDSTMTAHVAPAPTTCEKPDFGTRRKVWTGVMTVGVYTTINRIRYHGFGDLPRWVYPLESWVGWMRGSWYSLAASVAVNVPMELAPSRSSIIETTAVVPVSLTEKGNSYLESVVLIL